MMAGFITITSMVIVEKVNHKNEKPIIERIQRLLSALSFLFNIFITIYRYSFYYPLLYIRFFSGASSCYPFLLLARSCPTLKPICSPTQAAG